MNTNLQTVNIRLHISHKNIFILSLINSSFSLLKIEGKNKVSSTIEDKFVLNKKIDIDKFLDTKAKLLLFYTHTKAKDLNKVEINAASVVLN